MLADPHQVDQCLWWRSHSRLSIRVSCMTRHRKSSMEVDTRLKNHQPTRNTPKPPNKAKASSGSGRQWPAIKRLLDRSTT
jgi:hypothetical protein